jgi:hypothetical protein
VTIYAAKVGESFDAEILIVFAFRNEKGHVLLIANKKG